MVLCVLESNADKTGTKAARQYPAGFEVCKIVRPLDSTPICGRIICALLQNGFFKYTAAVWLAAQTTAPSGRNL